MNKKSTIAFGILMVLGILQIRAAETVTILAMATLDSDETGGDSDSYVLETGQIAVLEFAVTQGSPTWGSGNSELTGSAGLYVKYEGEEVKMFTQYVEAERGGIPFAGPMEFTVKFSGTNNYTFSSITAVVMATMTIYSQEEYTQRQIGAKISSNVGLQSNAVVIPSDSSGNVNLIMESSTDMVTWNAANPGLYSSDTSSRFFRVRAEAN